MFGCRHAARSDDITGVPGIPNCACKAAALPGVGPENTIGADIASRRSCQIPHILGSTKSSVRQLNRIWQDNVRAQDTALQGTTIKSGAKTAGIRKF
jgi:hypothetical protein